MQFSFGICCYFFLFGLLLLRKIGWAMRICRRRKKKRLLLKSASQNISGDLISYGNGCGRIMVVQVVAGQFVNALAYAFFTYLMCVSVACLFFFFWLFAR